MKSKDIKKIAAGIAAAVIVSGASYLYVSDFNSQSSDAAAVYSEQGEETELYFSEADVADISGVETYLSEDYEVNISEFYQTAEVKSSNAAANDTEYEIAMSKYGFFSLERNSKGIKKFKYGNNDTSEKYLVKGTAEFDKVAVKFDGYFLVDETLTGRKKGQLVMYKGTLSLPNGDSFEGELANGKYYSNGTYTWKDGRSYKGGFTTTNKLGELSLGENTASAYGTFYFNKTKTEYLYIRFVKSVPREAGYYYKNGVKYTVKFDSSGKCISTKKS